MKYVTLENILLVVVVAIFAFAVMNKRYEVIEIDGQCKVLIEHRTGKGYRMCTDKVIEEFNVDKK